MESMALFEDAFINAAGTACSIVGYVLIVVLFLFGMTYTIKTKGVQFRMLKESVRLTFSGLAGEAVKKKNTFVSSFQAFCVSMGARIGVGNIAGVAIAIMTGGPGAIFWMWLFAIIGAATSFVECTIGQIYKERQNDGLYHGGPAYYIKNGLKKPKFALFMAVLVIVAYPFLFTGVQANTVAIAFSDAFGVSQVLMALAVTLFAALIICGGVLRVAKVSSWLVPLMAVVYLGIALIIILMNITAVPQMLALIFTEAFSLKAGIGGLIGGVIVIGVQRGMFSNEAGVGSMPNVVSAAKVKHPAEQGLIQSLGVFIDTLVVCSATAFIVLLFGDYQSFGTTGVQLVQDILGAGFLGAAAPYLIAFFTLVFAFTCIISYYSMGEANVKFLSGKKSAMVIFRVLVIIMIFISCVMSLDLIWALNDIFLGIMAVTNIFALTFLGKHAVEALQDYRKQKKAGVEKPVFTPSCLSNADGVSVWPEKDE